MSVSDREKTKIILTAGIQNQKLFKKFCISYITFFLIPLIVCLMKLYHLSINLIKNMNPFILEPIHKLLFVIVIFFYLYDTIKKDLDGPFGFPYSYIYIGMCIFTVLLVSKQLLVSGQIKINK